MSYFYRLLNTKLDSEKIESDATKTKYVFDSKDVTLRSNSKIPWGRDGGTNINNTRYRNVELKSYVGLRSWWSTSNWLAEMYFLADKKEWEESKNDTYTDDINLEIIQEEVDKSQSIFINNILKYMTDEISYSKKAKKFWCNNDVIFTFMDKDHYDERHIECSKIVMSNIWIDNKGKETFYLDWNKKRSTIPKNFITITKKELESMLIDYCKIVSDKFIDSIKDLKFKETIK